MEPWMQWDEWNSMGCGGTPSEFDCVMTLGQAAANQAFQRHWGSWITQADINEMASLGLNTVRIPLGYWIKEDLVYQDSEHFPQGAFPYLENICKWARDAGFYIILDLHGAPGAQSKGQSFTGQNAPTAGFFVDFQYERAYKWLEWMTETVHTNNNFANVGAIQLVNEPQTPIESSLLDVFYPTAWKRIRAVEDRLGITSNNRLHIQMMDGKWGNVDPKRSLPDLYFALYDDHEYVGFNSQVDGTRDAYMRFSCLDDRSGNSPLIIGEWSLTTTSTSAFDLGAIDSVAWYKEWWAAQVVSYEKQIGWIFWTWKVNWINGSNDWRWGYQQAHQAGVIPTNPDDAHSMNACAGY